jgi:hypothetical protein
MVMDWKNIPSGAYVVIGALIGGGITLLTTLLNQRGQWRLERLKMRASREDAQLKELGVRFQAVATDFSSAAHSMCWLTWQADNGSMTGKMIENYNAEIHATLPKLIGGKISIAAMDETIGTALLKYVDRAHEVDAKIGGACLLFEEDSAKGIEALKQLHEDAKQFDALIYSELEIIGRAKQYLSPGSPRAWTARFSRQQIG